MALNEQPLLTIAIPTYNRNEILRANLLLLLPQIPNNVQIVIFDNCSDTSIQDTLALELKSYTCLKVIKNPRNIGACGNIIKCFENCDSEWMWLLGDDDTPCEDAVISILNAIELNSEVTYINFKSSFVKERNTDIKISGVNQLIEKLDNINNLFLISVGVYNVNKCNNLLRFAYLFSYSLVPHVVLMACSLGDNGSALYSSRQIVNNSAYLEPTASWSLTPFLLGVPVIIFELPINLTAYSRQKLSSALLKIVERPLKHLSRLSYLTHIEKIEMVRYIFKQPYLRMSQGVPLLWKIEYQLCRILLLNNKILRLFNIAIRYIKKRFYASDTDYGVERFNRV